MRGLCSVYKYYEGTSQLSTSSILGAHLFSGMRQLEELSAGGIRMASWPAGQPLERPAKLSPLILPLVVSILHIISSLGTISLSFLLSHPPFLILLKKILNGLKASPTRKTERKCLSKCAFGLHMFPGMA